MTSEAAGIGRLGSHGGSRPGAASAPEAGPGPSSAIDPTFQTAMRAILRQPLIVAGQDGGAHDEALRLIRRHRETLTEWLSHNAGWRLTVEPGYARLARTPTALGDTTHPARDARTGQPFTRRRYVLFALCLAELERAESQITLRQLSERLLLTATDPDLAAASFTFTMQSREERSDLVAVTRLLVQLGAARLVAGNEEGFVQAAEDADALYDIDRRVMAEILPVGRGPSTVHAPPEQRIERLVEEYPAGTEQEHATQLRHRLFRRLLADPVVYYADLSDAELEYLTRQRGFVTRRIAEATGLHAEVRAEGIAMVDLDGDLTDARMPARGGPAHLTLLLADHLAQLTGVATRRELLGVARRLQAEHVHHWGKNAAAAENAPALLDDSLDTLLALRLIARTPGATRDEDEFTALPAIGRFTLAPAAVEPTGRKAT